MRIFIITAILTSFLFACGNNSCPQNQKGLIGTLNYALNIMEMRDQSDIKLAFALYKRDLKALERGLNVKAFEGARFDKDLFIKEHAYYKKLEAQVDLIDTIYIVLNHDQREELHRLMAAHEHYLALLREESPQLCDKKRVCDKKKLCDKKRACRTKVLDANETQNSDVK